MIQEVQIDGLEPISPPEAVSFWPPQPGWYVVIALLLVLILFGIYRYIQYKRRNAYRKRALMELAKLESAPISHSLVSDLNHLLKATALAGYPRNQVADLTGRAWLEFLDHTAEGTSFTEEPNTILGDVSFSKKEFIHLSDDQWKVLVSNTALWIRKHRPSKMDRAS